MYRFCCILATLVALLFVCSTGQLSADLVAPPDDNPLQEVVPDTPVNPVADNDKEGNKEEKNDKKTPEDPKPATPKKGCGTFSMIDCMIVLAVLGACVHLNRNLRKDRKQE